jgi:hypothetical protein
MSIWRGEIGADRLNYFYLLLAVSRRRLKKRLQRLARCLFVSFDYLLGYRQTFCWLVVRMSRNVDRHVTGTA